MLSIKLKRIGKKHQASFRIITTEKRSKLVGKFIEDLGWYNPQNKEFNLNKKRVDYWMKNGAQPTDSIHNLLVRAKIINEPKKPVHKKSKKTQEAVKTQENVEEVDPAPFVAKI
ncbi:MAG: 30S ribosomal protein S16 [Patescibacteria group bacterium]